MGQGPVTGRGLGDGGGPPAVPGTSTSAATDPLTDPRRVAAARRLLDEVPGAAAFDRLSALAARLVGAGHAKVTLFTDQDTVVGGYGLPAGVIGGPGPLFRALLGGRKSPQLDSTYLHTLQAPFFLQENT